VLILNRLFRFDLRPRVCFAHRFNRLRHQLPERFPVETGEGKGDAAGLAEWNAIILKYEG
jgi:hypothetical protein